MRTRVAFPGTLLASLLFALAFAPAMPAPAASTTTFATESGGLVETAQGDFQVELLDDGTLSIVGYTGSDTVITIPQEIDGMAVTRIGDAAFFNQTRVTQIVLPDGIVHIGEAAFANCASLETFQMPDSVQTLGDFVFARDPMLEQVAVSRQLTAIPLQTFYGCKSLAALDVPDGVTTIGDAAFASCVSLSSLTLPDSLQTVGAAAFSECYSLANLTLPVVTLTADALSGTYFSDLVLTDNLVSVEDRAFAEASAECLHLPKTLDYIAPYAMTTLSCSTFCFDDGNDNYCLVDGILYTKDCKTLIKCPAGMEFSDNTVTFAEGVERIAPYAFVGAGWDPYSEDQESGITLVLPSSVTELGEYCFANSYVQKLVFGGSVATIPHGAFGNTIVQDLVLPEGVERIEEEAFHGLENLTSVAIPSTVEYISPTAFGVCPSLQAVIVSPDNQAYSTLEGNLYDKAGETLVFHPMACSVSDDGAFVVPEGTKSVGERAFMNQYNIVEVVFPTSLQTIGEKAFFACVSLTQVEIPSTVTQIGTEALGFREPAGMPYDLLVQNFLLVGDVDSAVYDYALANDVAFFTEEPCLSPEPVEMVTGETIQLDQTGIVGDLVQYTATDETLAYCDQRGNVKALSAGETFVVLSCGYRYILYPIHITGEAVDDGHIPTALQTGAAYGFDPEGFLLLDESNVAGYEEHFLEANADVSYDVLDNYCINCYTGNEYVPILAYQGDERRLHAVSNNPVWRDFRFFGYVSEGLYRELAMYRSVDDVVLYRGIPAAHELTGTGDTVADMRASIGQVFEPKTNVSTSAYHSVASGFSASSMNHGQAVLTIYAPADVINGSYISQLSEFHDEFEFLINEGSRFLILDAGVRAVHSEFSDGYVPERYFTLLLLGE